MTPYHSTYHRHHKYDLYELSCRSFTVPGDAQELLDGPGRNGHSVARILIPVVSGDRQHLGLHKGNYGGSVGNLPGLPSLRNVENKAGLSRADVAYEGKKRTGKR